MTDTMGDYRGQMRKLVWDMIDHGYVPDPDVQRYFGLQPASFDVLQMEEDESIRRLAAVLPVHDRIRELCGMATLVGHRVIVSYLSGDEHEEWAKAVVGVVSGALATAVIAELIDDGLLAVTAPEDPFV